MGFISSEAGDACLDVPPLMVSEISYFARGTLVVKPSKEVPCDEGVRCEEANISLDVRAFMPFPESGEFRSKTHRVKFKYKAKGYVFTTPTP